jgi:hypothetical protein
MPRKQETPHLRVRIEPRLLARLEKAREKSGRTLTGEIVSRLESSFRRDDHEELIAETVDKTLAALRALRAQEQSLDARIEELKVAAEGPPAPPSPPSRGGILGGLFDPLTESAASEPKTTDKQKD